MEKQCELLHIDYFTFYDLAELQKRADRADQSVLFFLAGANFWGKASEKQAKTC